VITVTDIGDFGLPEAVEKWLAERRAWPCGLNPADRVA